MPHEPLRQPSDMTAEEIERREAKAKVITDWLIANHFTQQDIEWLLYDTDESAQWREQLGKGLKLRRPSRTTILLVYKRLGEGKRQG